MRVNFSKQFAFVGVAGFQFPFLRSFNVCDHSKYPMRHMEKSLVYLTMNIDNYCRLCALPRFQLLQFFDKAGFKLNIAESITKYLKIEICEKDYLPRAVCLECSEKLKFTCSFIDATFEAQETLQRISEETDLLKKENGLSFDDSLGESSKHSTDTSVSVLEQEPEIPDKTLVSIDDVDSSFIEEYVENLSVRNDNYPRSDHNFLRSQSQEPGGQVLNKEFPRAFSVFSDLRCSNNLVNKTSSLQKTVSSNNLRDASEINTEPIEILKVSKDDRPKNSGSGGTIRINKGVFKIDIRESESSKEDVQVIEVIDKEKVEIVDSKIENEEETGDLGSRVVEKEDRKGGVEKNVGSKTVIKVEEKCFSKEVEEKKESEAANPFDDILWPCARCDHHYAKYDDLRFHYSSVHGVPMNYVCPLCSKKFAKSTNFYAHLKKHQPTFDSEELKLTKSKFSCDECSKGFPNKKLLDTHMALHSKEQLFPCDECGKSFRHQSLLQLHVRCHLPVDLKNKFQCDLCGKRFSTKPNLITHRRIHLGVRNYTCHQCGKSFIQKGNLDAHLLTHSSDKPFSCDICEKSFKTMLQLRKHHSVHTGAKPHQCDVCGRMFRERGTLREHHRIHTGAMPFSCEFCGKNFRFKGILTTHRRQHTGERPYSCQECQHHFTNWPNYNKHMKRRHGINTSKSSRVKTDPSKSSDCLSKIPPNDTEPLDFRLPDITEPYDPLPSSIDNLATDHDIILSNASNFYNVTSSLCTSNFNASSYVHPLLNNSPLISLYNVSHLANSVAPIDTMSFGQNVIDAVSSAHPHRK